MSSSPDESIGAPDPSIDEPLGSEPRPLLKIQRDGLEIGKRNDYDAIRHLGRLVADLAWHIAILRDRINDAGIPPAEEG